MLRAAHGKWVEMKSVIEGQGETGAADGQGRIAIYRVRHSQGAQWDFMLIQPIEGLESHLSPETVTYGLRDEEGKRGDGTLLVTSVDIDRARSAPLFRRRVLQGHSVFMTRISINDTYRRVDCEIHAKLTAEGYEPSGHWLVDNLQRIVPDAIGKTLPESRGAAP